MVAVDVVSVGSYFHVSGVRTRDLKEVAKTNGLCDPLHWPNFNSLAANDVYRRHEH